MSAAATVPLSHYGLHWFRRDLRVVGNPALEWSRQRHEGRVLGLFCFDHQFLARPDFSANRFAFFLETLAALRTDLRRLGGDLLVLDVGPRAAFSAVLGALVERGLLLPESISFNRDYEPFARQRDADMAAWLPKTFGVTVHSACDHLLVEPHELQRDGGGFYQIYTPFAKRWFALVQQPHVQARIAAQRAALQQHEAARSASSAGPRFALTWPRVFGGALPLADHLERYRQEHVPRATVPLPAAGFAAARTRLDEFLHNKLTLYAERRDIPAAAGTSQLSIYLKNGSLTSAQILAALGDVPADFGERDGPTTFLREIAWREFYYHILYHCPRVEHEAFLPRFRHLSWPNREDWFAAWQRGLTGYPIVDAGMRQLQQTGWMHNRVRMIVASFLTKDLLVDWRWGERYFMQQLLDGDLAPNNGGWQWAASTGCDPQPYFRVFNPTLQGRKFDPQGEYIRRYVPELRHLPDKFIHEPAAAGALEDYPRPLVDHKRQAALAVALYRQPRGS
jgi:deoxyribodipyrimidine photo-lyase